MVSSFNILLVPILGGFLFVKYSKLTKYRAGRDNGYLLFFKSAVVGFFFYGIAFIIWRSLLLSGAITGPALLNLDKFLISVETIPPILSLILIGVSIAIINLFIEDVKIKHRVIREINDPLRSVNAKCI